MTKPLDLAAELRELASKAAKQPWRHCESYWVLDADGSDLLEVMDPRGPHGAEFKREADAQLVATLVSNLPAILEALEDRERVDWLDTEGFRALACFGIGMGSYWEVCNNTTPGNYSHGKSLREAIDAAREPTK